MLIESVQPPAYSHIHQVEHIQRNNKGNLWNLVQIHREKIKQVGKKISIQKKKGERKCACCFGSKFIL